MRRLGSHALFLVPVLVLVLALALALVLVLASSRFTRTFSCAYACACVARVNHSLVLAECSFVLVLCIFYSQVKMRLLKIAFA